MMQQSAKPKNSEELCISSVSSPKEILSQQKLPYFLGISENSVGAKALSMSMVVIPPGECADPHYHENYESAIYLLQGEVETRYGENLEFSVTNRAGDFIFIPPKLYHQPFNKSESQQALAIVARNDPSETENVAHQVSKLHAD